MTEVPQKKPHIPIHQERAPSSAVSNAGQSCGSTDAMLTLGEGAFSGGLQETKPVAGVGNLALSNNLRNEQTGTTLS